MTTQASKFCAGTGNPLEDVDLSFAEKRNVKNVIPLSTDVFFFFCEINRKLLLSTQDYVCHCSILITAGNYIFYDSQAFKYIINGCSVKDISHKVAV